MHHLTILIFSCLAGGANGARRGGRGEEHAHVGARGGGRARAGARGAGVAEVQVPHQAALPVALVFFRKEDAGRNTEVIEA